jgi:hypothetical protein
MDIVWGQREHTEAEEATANDRNGGYYVDVANRHVEDGCC